MMRKKALKDLKKPEKTAAYKVHNFIWISGKKRKRTSKKRGIKREKMVGKRLKKKAKSIG